MLARVLIVTAALGACGTLEGVDAPGVGDDAGPDAGGSDAALEAAAEAGPEASTTIDLTPSKDAYVEDGTSVDTSFGTSAQLRVKGNSGGMLDRSSWLSFDIHAFTSVTSARLRLSVVSLDTGNTDPIPNLIEYAPTTSDGWDESTLTWNDAPPAGPVVAQRTVTDADLGMSVEFDVTAAVAADTDGVATFVVTSPPSTGRGLTYSSREGLTKPVLRVTGIVP
ncbi:MAG TPA: DNRLRE domain-containing protein [Labilithrix sp.]|jgi:hypothetical protein